MSSRSKLYEIARSGGGIVCRNAAIEAGISRELVESELASGRLVSVHPGVYRPAGVPDGLAIDRRAALLAAGPNAALSHRSAATAHGLVGGRPRPIEITTPYQQNVRLSGVVIHRTQNLPADHVGVIEDLRVTTVERTLSDLGAVIPALVVARSVQEAVVARKTTAAELYELVDQHGRRGRSGVGALRAALDDWVLSDKPPESKLELIFARLVDLGGIPRPILQYEIRDGHGTFVARVDAAWPDHRVAVELDGFAAHGTAKAMERDLARQNLLILAGWTPIRFTWNQVVRHPQVVLRQIHAALARP